MSQKASSYYKKKLFLALVDKKNNVLGRTERWLTHERGILHRGFTVVLIFEDKVVLQHRKHIVFDKNWDLTFSSHQIYVDKNLQSDEEAINFSLSRELNLTPKNFIGKLTKLGEIYYKAKDPNSVFTEHEVDHIYSVRINRLPDLNKDYAYQYKLISIGDVIDIKKFQGLKLAPWVREIITQLLALEYLATANFQNEKLKQ